LSPNLTEIQAFLSNTAAEVKLSRADFGNSSPELRDFQWRRIAPACALRPFDLGVIGAGKEFKMRYG
jgi:hypothetical protein